MEKYAKPFLEFIETMFEGLVEKETRPVIEKFFNDHSTSITIGVGIVIAVIVLAIIVAKMKKAG